MDSVFKKMLRSELDFQDIKVKELSRRTGISQRTLEGYLGARGSIPPADVAVKIAQVLHVSVEYLVTGSAACADESDGSEAVAMLSTGKRRFLKEFSALLQQFEITAKDAL